VGCPLTTGQKLGRILDEIKPEAVYFTEKDDQTVRMPKNYEIPPILSLHRYFAPPPGDYFSKTGLSKFQATSLRTSAEFLNGRNSPRAIPSFNRGMSQNISPDRRPTRA